MTRLFVGIRQVRILSLKDNKLSLLLDINSALF